MVAWRAKDGGEADVSVTLNMGAGWYTLSARKADGRQTDLRRDDTNPLRTEIRAP